MKKQSNQKPPFITTIIMLCILFSILSYIWEKFHTIIIIAAILASVLFIGYIISVLEKSRDEKLKSPSINSSNTHMSQELKNQTIKRQMEILFESTELMNNSNSVAAKVTAYIDGLCASAATVVACHCDRVVAANDSIARFAL